MLVASSMASYIYSGMGKADIPEVALENFYKSLCSYCEANMQVLYSWSASTPPPGPTPDPTVLIEGRVITTGSLSPQGGDTPETALGLFSAALNAEVSGWQILWPPGFVLPPAFILPAISLTPSMATTPEEAWLHVCEEIIAGITQAATPGPLPGAHGSYTIPTPGALWVRTL